MSSSAFELELFLGRFHPVLVHLPIGILCLLLLVELLALKPAFGHLTSARRVMLLAAALVAIGSATTGWLLAADGSYNERLLFWHRWTGVGIAAACVLMLVCHVWGMLLIYRMLLVGVAILLPVAGHLGGSLTHGSDYLGRYAPGFLKPLLGGKAETGITDIESESAFKVAIMPVFSHYCVSCHGDEKVKGGLRLDSYDAIMKGGEYGPVIVAGQPGESEMMKRLALAPDEDDHMPPEGKPQPGDGEIALLKWWIEAGAPAEATLRSLQPTPEIIGVVKSRMKASR